MPQEFMVLKCFSCAMFQVHQVRKSKTWKCKICNEKQSQQKIYSQGSGKECRAVVQEMNMKKNKIDEQEDNDLQYAEDPVSSNLLDEHRESRWQAFKRSSTFDDGNVTSSDEEVSTEMTRYDVKSIQESATLNNEEWAGCKKRRLKGCGAMHKTNHEATDGHIEEKCQKLNNNKENYRSEQICSSNPVSSQPRSKSIPGRGFLVGCRVDTSPQLRSTSPRNSNGHLPTLQNCAPTSSYSNTLTAPRPAVTLGNVQASRWAKFGLGDDNNSSDSDGNEPL